MKRLKELSISENFDATIPLMEAITLAIAEIQGNPLTEAQQNVAGMKKFYNSNKNLVKDAGVIAITQIAGYRKNEPKTLTLQAADGHERRVVGGIVDALVKSKAYTIYRMKYNQGKKSWIMRKV